MSGAAQSTFAQFLQGFTAPLRGLQVIAGRPKLLLLASGPALVNLLFVGLALVGAFHWAGPLSGWILPDGAPIVLVALAWALALVALTLGLGVLAYMAAALVAIPLNDAMSERVEGALGELPPPISVLEALPRSIRHSIAGFLLWAGCSLALLPLHLVPGLGSLLAGGLGLLTSAFFLAHQLLDGPMSRRPMRFRDKMAFLRAHLPWVLGLGGCGTVVLAVPLMNVLALPVLVAGGAVLWVELARDDRADRIGETAVASNASMH